MEIGAGTGANFSHYSPQAKVTAIEPSKHFYKHAQSKLANDSTNIQLNTANAEDLPFSDNTFDTTIATLTFCSIPNPTKALLEVRRVAKPNEKLLLIEHVLADTPIKRILLNLWNPGQRFLADGCNLNRDTTSNVTNAGLEIQEIKRFATKMGSPHLYIRAANPKKSY